MIAGASMGGKFAPTLRDPSAPPAIDQTGVPMFRDVPSAAVTTHWRCENDGERSTAPLGVLVEIGNPSCPSCDGEMDYEYVTANGVAASLATSNWTCAEHDWHSQTTMGSIAEAGTPLCGSCGDEMTLDDDVNIGGIVPSPASAEDGRPWDGSENVHIASGTNPWLQNWDGEPVNLTNLGIGPDPDNDCDCGPVAGVLSAMDTPEGIQTCDTCQKYDSDLTAAAALALALGPGHDVWFEEESDEVIARYGEGCDTVL